MRVEEPVVPADGWLSEELTQTEREILEKSVAFGLSARRRFLSKGKESGRWGLKGRGEGHRGGRRPLKEVKDRKKKPPEEKIWKGARGKPLGWLRGLFLYGEAID